MLGKDYTKEQYEDALAKRQKIKEHIQKLIGNDTVIIYPTAPVTPIKLGLDLKSLLPINDRITSYTCIANFGGFSQISLPAGFAPSGPVGLLVFGNRDTDEKLLSFAVQLSEILGLK